MGTISLLGVRTLSKTVNINTLYNLSDFFQFYPATTTQISNSDGSVYAASITFLDPSASLPNNGFSQSGFNLQESTYQDILTSNGTHDYGVYATLDGYQSAGNYAPYAINFSSIQIEFTTTGQTSLSINRFPGFAIYENAQTPDGRVSVSSVVPKDFSGVVTVLGNNNLFTSGSDTVDFNNLTTSQLAAVVAGAPPYNSQDGDDVITLPSIAIAANLGNSGISYNLSTPLNLGAGTDTVYGSDGLTSVAAGTGLGTIYLQRSGATALSYSASTGALLVIPNSTAQEIAGTVSHFSAGNILAVNAAALTGSKPLTSFARGAEVVLYSGATPVADFSFSPSTNVAALQPMTYAGGGTAIVTDTSATQLIYTTPAGYSPAAAGQIDWSFIDANEGGSYNSPYVAGANMTIGIGVDLGTGITENQFKSIFPSWSADPTSTSYDANLAFLYNAIQDTGGTGLTDLMTGAVRTVVGQHINSYYSTSVSVTTFQANKLTNWAQNDTLTRLSTAFGSGFNALPGGIETVLIDIAYNAGVAGVQNHLFWSDAEDLDLSDPTLRSAGLLKLYVDMINDPTRNAFLRNRIINDAIQEVLPLFLQANGYVPPVSQVPTASTSNTASFQFSADTTTTYALSVQTPTYTAGTAATAALDSVARPDMSTIKPFTLTETAGSPLFASLFLPDAGASAFSVAFEQNGTWSQPIIEQPGATETFTSGAEAIAVTPVDSTGAATTFDGGNFIFDFNVTFASAGEFQGLMTEPDTIGSLPVYRFFDTSYGTHLFTQSLSEAQTILTTRPDLTQETNGFGAVSATNPSAEAVYRFFETSNGTHFFTASATEFLGLTTPGSAAYRQDLTYEAISNFYEDATQQAGDAPVYRLFDTAHGTQFLTGDQNEYTGLTTPGSSTYRPDLTSEGIAFYAPTGTFHT